MSRQKNYIPKIDRASILLNMSEDNFPYRALGDYLRQAREGRGWSKAYVQRALGKSSWDTVNKWEKGARRPEPDTLADLVRILGLDEIKAWRLTYGKEPVTDALFPHAEEAIRYGEHTRERAYFIWAKGFEVEGFEASLFTEKDTHEVIPRYMQGEVSDAELYEAARKRAKEVIAKIQRKG